jgi:serine/threonine protein kinase
VKRGAVELAELSRLLDAALELPLEERPAWIEQLAPEHESLKPALRKLLETQPARNNTFTLSDISKQVHAAMQGAACSAESLEFTDGARVGPYELIRELGRGGMGTVWLARRTEGLTRRTVALKLPHAGMLHAEFAARMSRERDILESLAHPNIARLYDAGVTPAGQPYLALEYIEGVPINVYCDSKRLSVPARIRLFVQVLQAIQYAHSHLVIHRDLKPANILVTDAGNAVVLDFGIAKLMVEGTTADTALTQFGGRALTPDYASPEQIAAQALTTASDVYSLGVIFYELLTGERPYRLARQSASAMEEAILSANIRRPSQAATDAGKAEARSTTPARLTRALRGDLDTIVLTAMRLAVAERYRTVDALAIDIDHHLHGRAINARAESLWEGARRFIVRNKVVVSAGLAVVLALAVGLSAAIMQARVATEQRQRAFTLLAQNQAVSEFVDRMLTELASSGEPITVDTLVERGEALASSAAQRSPEHQAAILLMLSSYYSEFDRSEKAEPLLIRALDLMRGSGDQSLRARLICERASLSAPRDPAAAQREIQMMLGAADLPDDALAACARASGHVFLVTGDLKNALKADSAALKTLGKLQPPNPLLEATALIDVAQAEQLSGHASRADRAFAMAVQKFTQADRTEHPMVTNLWNAWANADDAAGDFAGALVKYQHALDNAAKHAAGGQPPVILVFNYARMLAQLGRFDEALVLYQRNMVRAEQSGSRKSLLNGMIGEARVLLALERTQAAEAVYDRAAAEIGVNVARETAEGIGAYAIEAKLAAAHGDFAHAVAAYTHAIEFFDARNIKVGALVAALYGRGDVHLRNGDIAAALADAQRALEVAHALQGERPASAHTGLSLALQSRIQDAGGNKSAGTKLAQEAALQLRTALGPEHPETKRMLVRIVAGSNPSVD